MPEISIQNPDALGKPLGQYSQLTRVKAAELLSHRRAGRN